MTPGEMLLVFRQNCIRIYRTYERIFFPIIKFLLVLMVLLGINASIGYMSLLNKAVVCMGIAIVAMMLPINYIIIIFMAVITIHMATFNLLIGGITAIAFITIYCMYVRLYPKESLLIIITMIALKCQLGYAVPLIAALFGGMACIVPMALGVLLTYIGAEMNVIIEGTMEIVPENIVTMIISIINQNVLTNTTMLSTIGIFTIVFIIVYIIRKQSIDYAHYIAIVIGGVMSLLGFGIAILFLAIKINVFLLILMTIISIILAIICEFTSKVLDYSRAETVQFEDDDNYYYVKVVPKISINVNQTRVEQVYTTPTKENSMSVDKEAF
ncbi:MAG: hypothetical protein RR618_04125 [Cellulosilyticaceae bacterium]